MYSLSLYGYDRFSNKRVDVVYRVYTIAIE